MEIISTIFVWLIVLCFVAMPVFWIWAGYHVFKCHKKENCNNRECTYWNMCNHNAYERQKDQLLWRIKMVEANSGEDLSELKEKLINK